MTRHCTIDPETIIGWRVERRLLNSYRQIIDRRVKELDDILAAFAKPNARKG